MTAQSKRSHGAPAGIAFLCRDNAGTGEFYILFGKEAKIPGNPLCFPYGRAEAEDNNDRSVTAAREAAEETCHVFGTPAELHKLIEQNNHWRVYGAPGTYLVDLGVMSDADRARLVQQFLDKRNEDGRNECEQEMSELIWMSSTNFCRLDAQDHVPGFGLIRSFCAKAMRKMIAEIEGFRQWAKDGRQPLRPSNGRGSPKYACRRLQRRVLDGMASRRQGVKRVHDGSMSSRRRVQRRVFDGMTSPRHGVKRVHDGMRSRRLGRRRVLDSMQSSKHRERIHLRKERPSRFGRRRVLDSIGTSKHRERIHRTKERPSRFGRRRVLGSMGSSKHRERIHLTKEQQHTFLDYAKQNKFAEMQALIKENDAYVNVQPARRWSALHHAAKAGDKAVVEFLLAHGANLRAETKDGHTAWDVAEPSVKDLVAIDGTHPPA